MTNDKYGVDNDPYCYPGTTVLINLLDLRDESSLADAERDLSFAAARVIEFKPPPYDLSYLQHIHRQLLGGVYSWAGEVRTVDISKARTRFCNASRIQPEAAKLFESMMRLDWFEGLSRTDLIKHIAEAFGDFNVVHPFREGSGRAQRVLFEQLIINAGYEISWDGVDPDEWVDANVAAFEVDYGLLEGIFGRCIGSEIPASD